MNKPIGYWLRHLDALLEESMARALAEHAVTRREWQALNVLAIPGQDPHDILEPFPGVGDAVEALTAKGWAQDGRLTADGKRAHATIAERVGHVRRRAVEGVSPHEYQATVDVLRRMAANLETA
ncbi:MarR family winged helix-turn-helix transcriptional regulator [Nonomuraea sp. LPB2021202275-12-8]|uniref:MarR family winged helix-turn-helix transcriptional regulator n=1 Tax=Nonomuraea sp. LPB2021202275-12-8 TaxID=3120159 RepID=UPI00300D4A16